MEELTHPVFGELRWDAELSQWAAGVRTPAGDGLEVTIQPGDADRSTAVEQAADLFTRLMAAEPRIVREAVRQELLEDYNDIWRDEGEPELTAEQRIGQLALGLLEISVRSGDTYPFTVWYSPRGAELFGGHDVALILDPAMHVHTVDLRG